MIALTCLAGQSLAGLSQSTIAAPGGFIQACASPATPGSSAWAGSDFTPYHTAPGSDVHEQSFAGDLSAARSASYSVGNTTNSASGTVGMGYLDFQASNNAPNSSSFARADANGGWKETFTVSNPAFTGQSGFMQFTIHVIGTIAVSGFAGAAGMHVTAYKDNFQLLANALSNPGNSDIMGTDRQYGGWSLASDFSTLSKPVDGTATFAVPITFGSPFSLGVYANARAGMRSSSGAFGNSQATVTISSLVWGGITNIYVGNSPVGGSTVSSGTGIDWTQPTVPPGECSGDLNGDGQVDDADFSLFVVAYNILDCADPSMPAGCPADLNGDQVVDDADFSVFVVAYNALLCP